MSYRIQVRRSFEDLEEGRPAVLSLRRHTGSDNGKYSLQLKNGRYSGETPIIEGQLADEIDMARLFEFISSGLEKKGVDSFYIVKKVLENVEESRDPSFVESFLGSIESI